MAQCCCWWRFASCCSCSYSRCASLTCDFVKENHLTQRLWNQRYQHQYQSRYKYQYQDYRSLRGMTAVPTVKLVASASAPTRPSLIGAAAHVVPHYHHLLVLVIRMMVEHWQTMRPEGQMTVSQHWMQASRRYHQHLTVHSSADAAAVATVCLIEHRAGRRMWNVPDRRKHQPCWLFQNGACCRSS